MFNLNSPRAEYYSTLLIHKDHEISLSLDQEDHKLFLEVALNLLVYSDKNYYTPHSPHISSKLPFLPYSQQSPPSPRFVALLLSNRKSSDRPEGTKGADPGTDKASYLQYAGGYRNRAPESYPHRVHAPYGG